jgi:hypothetical protein
VNRMVEIELARHEWSALRVMGDRSADIPERLRDLLRAADGGEADRCYWRLENTVVVQGSLFQAAPAVVDVVMAALASGELSAPARVASIELLYQLVRGESDVTEAERGVSDLGERCRRQAREGIWLLYRELAAGSADGVRDILDVIEADPRRLSAHLSGRNS